MQPLQLTFTALLLAHLIADFPLQWKWISDNKGTSGRALLCHGLVHLALAWPCLLLLAPVHFLSFRSQGIVLAYLAIHLGIDKLKSWITARNRMKAPPGWTVFLLDQLLHVVCIALAAAWLSRTPAAVLLQSLTVSAPARMLAAQVACVYVGVVFGGGYLIRTMTKELAARVHAKREESLPGSDAAEEDLKDAGMYIGWLERFLVVTAFAMKSPVLAGLILTGKSIARFPEFRHKKFAEYYLIGTLLSVSLSVLGGVLLLIMLNGVDLFK